MKFIQHFRFPLVLWKPIRVQNRAHQSSGEFFISCILKSKWRWQLNQSIKFGWKTIERALSHRFWDMRRSQLLMIPLSAGWPEGWSRTQLWSLWKATKRHDMAVVAPSEHLVVTLVVKPRHGLSLSSTDCISWRSEVSSSVTTVLTKEMHVWDEDYHSFFMTHFWRCCSTPVVCAFHGMSARLQWRLTALSSRDWFLFEFACIWKKTHHLLDQKKEHLSRLFFSFALHFEFKFEQLQ